MISAVGIWDWSALSGPIVAQPNGGFQFTLCVGVRDSVANTADTITGVVVQTGSDDSGLQVVQELTTAVVNACAGRGYTVARSNVKLPGFTNGQ